MLDYKKLILLAAAGVLGFSTQAAAQLCTVSGVNPVCTGTVSTNIRGAVLLKVSLNDLDPTDPEAQSLSVEVCDDASPVTDTFILDVMRTASPRNIERCVTPDSTAACSVTASSKPASAKSDSVLVVLGGLKFPPGFDSGKFVIRGPGWEQMKAQVLATNDGSSISFISGLSCSS